MTKIQNSIFIFLIFIFYLLSSIFYLQPIRALESTLTSTSSADFKSKLKALQDDIASKAVQLKEEISKKLQNKAYVGTVKSKSDNTFSLGTFSGDKTVVVNDYTIYLGKTKTSFKALLVGDNIATLGDVDDKDVLTAKKIFKLDSAQEERKVIFGFVASIKDSTFNIQTKDNQNFSIQVDKSTSYQLGQSKISFGDIKGGRLVVVVGTNSKDNQIKARFIYLLPGEGINIKSQTSTSSATPSAAIKPTKIIK